MHAASVNCTADASACRSAEMDGKAGRYMSLDSGPNADSDPRMTISRALRRRAVLSAVSPAG
jgi:hypothetical protein